jgi:catabolite regulation protein CreA
MAGRIWVKRSRSRGPVLALTSGMLVLVLAAAAPAGSADDAALAPVDGAVGTAESAQAAPTISVYPSTDLTTGQPVTVTGSGFTPNSPIGVSMCDDPVIDGTSCDLSTANIGRSDGAGGFTMTYNVVDTINGHTCVPSGCLIGGSNLNVQNEFANQVSLGFAAAPAPTTDGSSPPTAAPDSPAPAALGADAAAPDAGASQSAVAAQATPTISVSPSSGLSNGQSVTITGSGFTPNSSVGVSMCDDPIVDGSSCDLSTAKVSRSDGSGGFTMTYNVVDTINGHTCVPSGCLIGGSNLNVENEFSNQVSLSFGTGSTTTTAPGSPGSTPTTGAPGASGGSSGGAPGGTTTNGNGTLASTGASDRLRSLAVGGIVLMALGAATTMATSRVRDLKSG